MITDDIVLMATARRTAFSAHFGQYRRDGVTPYSEHIMAVVDRVRRLDNASAELISVAYLHDVIEDSDITTDMLLNLGLPAEVVTAVDALTKKKNQSYDDYLVGVKNNPMALSVKIQDILSNLSDSPTTKQIRKYSKALLFLVDESTAAK